MQFIHRPARLAQRGRLGLKHEGEGGRGGVAHNRDGALILVLGVLDGGRRADTRLTAALLGRVDAARPLDRQRDQAQGVAGGRGIEDHDLEDPAAIRWHVDKVGEAVEGGYLSRAGAAHLLLHHRHNLRREGGADGSHRVIDVLGGRLVGVDLHRKEVRHPDDWRDRVANRLPEDITQI